MITLYVLENLQRNKKYVGITNNLSRRIKEHQSSRTKAGQLLGQFELVHTESFIDYKTARIREKFLKSGQGRVWLNQNVTRACAPRSTCAPKARSIPAKTAGLPAEGG